MALGLTVRAEISEIANVSDHPNPSQEGHQGKLLPAECGWLPGCSDCNCAVCLADIFAYEESSVFIFRWVAGGSLASSPSDNSGGGGGGIWQGVVKICPVEVHIEVPPAAASYGERSARPSVDVLAKS